MVLSYIRSFANIIVYLLIKDKTTINADIKRYLESYEITPPSPKKPFMSGNLSIVQDVVGSS